MIYAEFLHYVIQVECRCELLIGGDTGCPGSLDKRDSFGLGVSMSAIHLS